MYFLAVRSFSLQGYDTGGKTSWLNVEAVPEDLASNSFAPVDYLPSSLIFTNDTSEWTQ